MAIPEISNTSAINNPKTMQDWITLLESVTGGAPTNTTSNTDTTTSNTSEANDPIKALLAMLLPGATGGVNNPQAQQLIAALLTQFKEGAGGLSGIQAAGNAAGVYNSSTQGLLANDAMARAVAQAAGIIQTGQNNSQQVIANLLATLGNNSRTTRQTGNTSSSSQKGPSPAGKIGASALGAAAAQRALSNLLNKKPSPSNSDVGRGGSPTGQDSQQSDLDKAQREQDLAYAADKGEAERYPAAEPYNPDSDPATFYGTEDYGANGYSDPNVGQFVGPPEDNSADPFGVGGWDISDFLGGDSGQSSFEFVGDSSGSDVSAGFGDFGGGDIPGGDWGGDGGGFDLTEWA